MISSAYWAVRPAILHVTLCISRSALALMAARTVNTRVLPSTVMYVLVNESNGYGDGIAVKSDSTVILLLAHCGCSQCSVRTRVAPASTTAGGSCL